MTWADARARVTAILAAAAITDPIVQTMKRVYETEYSTIQDLPCCVLKEGSVEVGRMTALREKTYQLGIDLIAHDADPEREILIVAAFREAILDLFDADVTLAHTATIITGPTCQAPRGITLAGGGTAAVIEMALTIRMHTASQFG